MSSGLARSPINRSFVFAARTSATAVSNTPMSTEANPSNRGSSKETASHVPTAAMARPRRGRVFQQHHELWRILAPLQRLPERAARPDTAKDPKRDDPARAFEKRRQRQDDENHR